MTSRPSKRGESPNESCNRGPGTQKTAPLSPQRESGAVASDTGNGAYWFFGLAVAFLIAVVAYVWITAGPDQWTVCDDAVQARLYPPVDYDSSKIYWTDGVEGTRIANGTVHSGAETYNFQCGVTDGELDWIDLTPAR